MSCTFYTFRQGDYFCTKQGKYVDSDTYYKYCRNYDYRDCPIFKFDGNSSGCYLTTACITAKALPDDCYELQTLRSFRDNWLKKQPNGAADIAEYYRIAPRIVAQIKALPNAKELFTQLYQELVIPCVKLIEEGRMEETYTLYKETTVRLKKVYCE